MTSVLPFELAPSLHAPVAQDVHHGFTRRDVLKIATAVGLLGVASFSAVHKLLSEPKKTKLRKIFSSLPKTLDGTESISSNYVPGSEQGVLFMPIVHGDSLMRLPPEEDHERFPQSFAAKNVIYANMGKMLNDFQKKMSGAFPLPVYWEGVEAGNAGSKDVFQMIKDVHSIDMEIEALRTRHGDDPSAWASSTRRQYNSLICNQRRVAVHLIFPPVIRALTLRQAIQLRGFETRESSENMANLEFKRKVELTRHGSISSDLGHAIDVAQLQRTIDAAAVIAKEGKTISLLGMGIHHEYFTNLIEMYNAQNPNLPLSHATLTPKGIPAYLEAEKNEDDVAHRFLAQNS